MIRIIYGLLLVPAFILGFQFLQATKPADTLVSAAVAPETELSETRCGWFSNPTPANASLFDREAEWIIGVQGGHQADGDWGDFGKQWVKTNINYGYGCACMKTEVDKNTKEVSKIEDFKVRPLAVCRKDRALKKWGFK